MPTPGSAELRIVGAKDGRAHTGTNAAAVFMFNDEFRFFWASRSATAHCGYSCCDLRRMRPWDLKSDFDQRGFIRLVAPLRAGSPVVAFNTPHRIRSGKLVPVAVEIRRHYLAIDGAYYVAIVREIDHAARQQPAAASERRQMMRLNSQLVECDALEQARRLSRILLAESRNVRTGDTAGTADNLAYLSAWVLDVFGG